MKNKMALAIKLLSLLLLVSWTLAQEYGFDGHYLHHEPAHHQSLDEHHGHDDFDLDYHAHPKYTFDYSVKDPHTGDDKEHWETRDGDKVKGSYTLTETDGTKRVVEYEADDKNGFNAVVHKIGTPKEEHKPIVLETHKHVYETHKQEYEPEKEYEPQYHHHHHGFPQFDDGFVPIMGYGEH